MEAYTSWLMARYAARLAASARLEYPDHTGVVTRTWTTALGNAYRRLPERPPRQRGGPAPAIPLDASDGPPPY